MAEKKRRGGRRKARISGPRSPGATAPPGFATGGTYAEQFGTAEERDSRRVRDARVRLGRLVESIMAELNQPKSVTGASESARRREFVGRLVPILGMTDILGGLIADMEAKVREKPDGYCVRLLADLQYAAINYASRSNWSEEKELRPHVRALHAAGRMCVAMDAIRAAMNVPGPGRRSHVDGARAGAAVADLVQARRDYDREILAVAEAARRRS